MPAGVSHAPSDAEPTGAAVTGTHFGRGKSDPLRVPPAVGQFSHDSGGRALVEIPFDFVHNGGGGRSDACDVLQNEEPRTAVVSDVNDPEEEAGALAVKPSTATCKAEVLAGETCSDAIHCTAPCSSVEGEHVGPDRSRVQASFFDARRQDAGSVSFPLNVADGASLDAQMSEPGSQSFSEHAHSGAQLDGM
jgi:hypothetical protein